MIVISLLFDHAPAALANHRRYARGHGYRHIEIDMSEISGCSDETRWIIKYETLLHQLGLANEDELVLLLNENAAILRPLALPELMQGRDWLLTCIESDLPQLDMQIWRKTEHVMRELFEIVTRCRNGVVLPKEEALLLQAFAYCPSRYRVGDVMAVVPASTNVESVWAHWSAFSVKICDQKHHRRFRNALLEHINDCQTRGLPLLSLNDTGITDTSAVSIRQPNRSVAIVTLYTPNIAIYGRIAEANFTRYCERHGYTLYVHREIPAHLNDGKTSGNWLKAALLRETLPNHEWIFWVDADVLIKDMNRPLESIMHDKEAVFARDIGYWRFNSGIMGLKRTQRNYDSLHRILEACNCIDDKSTVYANKGDQYYFNAEFAARPDFDATQVASLIDFNTPWIYQRPTSFMVHYIGIWETHKALLMDYDLRQSARD